MAGSGQTRKRPKYNPHPMPCGSLELPGHRASGELGHLRVGSRNPGNKILTLRMCGLTAIHLEPTNVARE